MSVGDVGDEGRLPGGSEEVTDSRFDISADVAD